MMMMMMTMMMVMMMMIYRANSKVQKKYLFHNTVLELNIVNNDLKRKSLNNFYKVIN